MKRIKLHAILFLFLFSSQILFAQEISIKKINKEILFKEIKSKTEYKYHMVCIFTNKCIGTTSMFERIKFIESNHVTNTNIILCCSSREKHAKLTQQLVKHSGTNINQVYLIDRKIYREKWLEDRVKGFQFRNDICEDCREHEIGVPYTIIFTNSGEVHKYGYLDRHEILEILKN